MLNALNIYYNHHNYRFFYYYYFFRWGEDFGPQFNAICKCQNCPFNRKFRIYFSLYQLQNYNSN